MKNIEVKYNENGKITNVSDNSLHFEQENESLCIKAQLTVADGKFVRAYIKAPNNNSTVTEAISKDGEYYPLVIRNEYMSKGTLYVGFEVYDDNGYIERYEPLKVYVDGFVNPGNGSSDNVYVVTVDVAEVETLEPGSQAYVENVGTKKDMRLKFGIPQGPQGDKGEPGKDATIKIGTVTTLEPGSNATVANNGTQSYAILNFGIPQGDKGDTGEQGVQGEPGYTPIKGEDYYTEEEREAFKSEVLGEVETLTFDYYYKVASLNPDVIDYQRPGIHKINMISGSSTINQTAIIITMKYAGGFRQLVLHSGYIKTRIIKSDGTLMDWDEYVLSSTLNTKLTTKADKTVVDSLSSSITTLENNAIECTSSGAVINIKDSANAKLRGLKLYGKTEQFTTTGKNLIPYPYATTSQTINGITFIDNGDGTITVNGTATNTVIYRLIETNKQLPLSAGGYVFSGNPTGGSASTYCMQLKTSTSQTYYDVGSGSTIKFDADVTFYVLIYIATGVTINNLTFKPMLEVGTAVTEFEPYTGGIASPNPEYPQALESIGDSGSVDVELCGKNLIPYPYNSIAKLEGIEIIDNGDGSLTINGAYSTLKYIHLATVSFPKNKLLFFSCKGLPGYGWEELSFHFIHYDTSGAQYLKNTMVKNGSSNTLGDDYSYTKIYVCVGRNKEIHTTLFPMVEVGSTVTEYEPFKKQSISISTPNGLPGISDFQDTNFTCDEVDFEKGVFNQKIRKLVCTGEEDIYGESSVYNGYTIKLPEKSITGICSHTVRISLTGLNNGNKGIYLENTQTATLMLKEDFPTLDDLKTFLVNQYNNGTPFTILYRMGTPIETPLTDEEIEAYKALTTYKPVTNIFNSDNAHMEVDYVADTKTYIDNKFTELQNAIISTGGNV